MDVVNESSLKRVCLAWVSEWDGIPLDERGQQLSMLIEQALSYIVDSVDEWIDAAVAHGQDVARHPHVVDACEAEKLRLFSVPNTEMREEPWTLI